MAGDVVSLRRTERKPRPNVGSGGGRLEKRVSALESRMTEADQKLSKISGDTEQILGFVQAAQGVGGFFTKHGPRLVAFATGILATAGIGNPEVWRFVGGFFGSG